MSGRIDTMPVTVILTLWRPGWIPPPV